MIEFLEKEVLEAMKLIQLIHSGFLNKTFNYYSAHKSKPFFQHTNNHIAETLADNRMHF